MSYNWTVQAFDLASTVRHDLRDPLGAIAHWVQLLETPGIDPTLQQQALQGIRAAVSEQLKQIEQLSELLEQSDPSSLEDLSRARFPQARKQVDLVDVLDQVSQSVPAPLRKRLQRMDRWPVAPTVSRAMMIQADEPALVQALSTLATLGLKQLLDHEQLVIGLQPQAPPGASRMALQIRVHDADQPIDQPWRCLSELSAAPGLTLLYARSVLSLHRADLNIATTVYADDTVLLDFPLTEPAFDNP